MSLSKSWRGVSRNHKKTSPRWTALAKCGGLSLASLPSYRGLNPLGPPEPPLERSAVPSHATAFSSPLHLPCLDGVSCVRRTNKGPCPFTSSCVRGPERVASCALAGEVNRTLCAMTGEAGPDGTHVHRNSLPVKQLMAPNRTRAVDEGTESEGGNMCLVGSLRSRGIRKIKIVNRLTMMGHSVTYGTPRLARLRGA